MSVNSGCLRIFLASFVYVCGEETCVSSVCNGSRAEFIVVVQNVIRTALPAISSFAGPVVNYIVTQIYFFHIGTVRVAAAAKTRGTIAVVGNQVVMECSRRSTP